MQIISIIALLSALLTGILAGSSNYPPQLPLISPLDSTKVPGKSPVEICSLSPDEDLVEIKYINLTPNPPQAGENLTIDAMGVLKVPIKEGSYANYEVKYGFIKLLTGTADLCEKAAEVDLECPIKEGEVKLDKLIELPSQIPPVIPRWMC
jgi:hypothetical protein